jgi:flavin-dependent dehydrogenase
MTEKRSDSLKLENGSRIAVIGGGPAGTLFSYFLLDQAQRTGVNCSVDIYEPKDFSKLGPIGCNHCGGIISESLVQILSSEGIIIPPQVLRGSLDSYILHMEVGSAKIETPLQEKRIAAVYRGAGPLGAEKNTWDSFDTFLLELAKEKGASHITDKVTGITREDGFPVVSTKTGVTERYDFIAGSVGLLQSSLDIFKDVEIGYHPPDTTKTHICEFHLGTEHVKEYFGSSMHVFLLNIPRLDFAALIPKGEFVTLALLGRGIDKELVNSFLNAPEVKRCFPPNMSLSECISCQCYPKINIKSAHKPFGDRVVLIGDCATSKLYKNGIGAAYFTARTAASVAIHHGISSEDFEAHYWPACKSITRDNLIGSAIFLATRIVQKLSFAKRGILRMVVSEQQKKDVNRLMSLVLWDTFTGSDTYMSIVRRSCNPAFLTNLVVETVTGLFSKKSQKKIQTAQMGENTLGKIYTAGDTIVSQGESGDCMYVILSGTVEILQKKGEKDVLLAELGEKDFFGEMALFEREVRSATVRAKDEVRVLTIDKKTLLRRIQEDPVMAFRIVEKMSSRIRDINIKLSRIKASDRRNWDNRTDSNGK